MKVLTVGFTTHRPEMVALTEEQVESHDALFLEEPPAAGFNAMLAGRLAIEDYLAPMDLEYPDYSRRMCRMLRRVSQKGSKLFQVEPFMEALVGLHEFFAEGHTPADIESQGLRRAVYAAERNATGALLSYYRSVMTGSFDAGLAAVKTFARHDAARFRLRDKLRAIAISNRTAAFRRPYVEAGMIHYGIYPLLRQQLKNDFHVKPVFTSDAAFRRLGRKKRHLYGPGDQLTLLYIFHPRLGDSEPRSSLLAARALIFVKLIEKEEMTNGATAFPHILNEAETTRMVDRLDLEDCRRLFPAIRRLSTPAAVAAVKEYQASA